MKFLEETRDMGRAPPRLLGLSDIAQAVGMTRQAIADYHKREKLPRPDFLGSKGGPLWRAGSVADWIETHRRSSGGGV